MGARMHEVKIICLLFLLLAGAARARILVTVDGPGGAASGTLPSSGGAFDLSLPLSSNAINNLTVTAVDDKGNKASQQLAITQVALDAVVVSRIVAEPLTVQQVQQLVNDGVINLDQPENYNVSQFTIVLTIGQEEVPVQVPIVMNVTEPDQTGYEVYKFPKGGDGGGGKPPERPRPEIIVFQQPVPVPPGVPAPPPIPGVIIIEGRIKSLKEFYSVRLLLMNTSGIFTLHDVMGRIEYPDGGLSSTLPADGIATYGDILPGDGTTPGQQEKQFIIRGDAIGVRRVRVNFGGTLIGPGIPEETPIPFNGSAETTVEVKGPPTFTVLVAHPDSVTANVPYAMRVDITNTGETPALYASLSVDVGADAYLVKNVIDPVTGEPKTEPVMGVDVRSLGNIFPGQTASATFTIHPLKSGPITSAMAMVDQNINLQVQAGAIGCPVGYRPVPRAGISGPTAEVLPLPNALGIGTDSPVVAFFSELMDETTISGGFKVLDEQDNVLPGELRLIVLDGRTVAIWQFKDNITNRLAANARYTVYLDTTIKSAQGVALASTWTSQFSTTGMGAGDFTPPVIALSLEPPANPNLILPGQIIKIDAYASDQGSGIGRVEARIRDLTDMTTAALIDQKSIFTGEPPPYIFTLDSASLVPGHTFQIVARAYDQNGNARDATLALILASSAAPPWLALPPDPAQPVLQGTTLDLTPLALSPIVREVRFFLDGVTTPTRTVTLPPFQASVGTLALALGSHNVRAVALDALGRQGEATLGFTVGQNTTPPSISFQSPASGTSVIQGNSVIVAFTVQDLAGVATVKALLDGTSVSSGIQSFAVNTAGLALGQHVVAVEAINTLGNVGNAQAAFQVREAPPSPTPPAAPQAALVAVSWPVDGKVTVTGQAGAVAAAVGVRVANQTLGSSVNVTAGGDGSFTAALAALAGDALAITAYNAAGSSPAVTFTVSEPPVLAFITLEPNPIMFNQLNQTRQLSVTGHYLGGATANLTGQATFTTDKPAVAAVSSGGTVAARGAGSAQITAQVQDKSASVTVNCTMILLSGIAVSPSQADLAYAGQTQALQVIGYYNNGTSQTLSSGVSFATGDPAVAAANSAGVITAAGQGTTQIQVSLPGVAPVPVGVSVDFSRARPPVATILSPANGSVAEPGKLMTVNTLISDELGQVREVTLGVSGAMSYSEVRTISPPKSSTQEQFSFLVPLATTLGGTLQVTVTARNNAEQDSQPAAISLQVADQTAPAARITAPSAQARYHYGDTVSVLVSATDAVGVTEVDLQTTGAMTISRVKMIVPAASAVATSFSFAIPYGLPFPEVRLIAAARDASGNAGQSPAIPILVTNADITPPSTIVTVVASPGLGATAPVTYQVISGLEDLDHVELYFRRNGIGTFSRYTDAAGGNPQGIYQPQSGNVGTIPFDSTRMGGDGTYEFYTVGVDQTGNREPAPRNAYGKPEGDPDATAVFATGAPVAVITTSQEVTGPGYDNQNLRVIGATLTLVGPHTFQNVELLGGAVLTHREADLTTTYSLPMTAWTLTVDASSTLNLDGRGHIGGRNFNEAGRTLGNGAGSTQGAGGSHGGLGGAYGSGIPNPVYGDLTNPAELGSGGGAWSNEDGGDGGGLLILNAINVVVDGAIRADGARPAGSAAGGGSGGGINIHTRTLAGAGLVQADGATGVGVAGGGGRVAVYYYDISTFTPGQVSAAGATGPYGSASANGTVFLKQEAQGNGELVIEGQGPSSPYTQLPIPPGAIFDAVTLQKNARVYTDDPLHVTGKLWITGGSVLSHSAGSESGLAINAGMVQIDAGSAIDVSARGYRGGRGFNESGLTLGGAEGSRMGAGGSYGGLGGGYQGNPAGIAYGDPKNPVFLGSGGGAWSSAPGGDGGGRLSLRAATAVIVEGAIRADGGNSAGSAAGAGSGGSLLIQTSRLAGSGLISAGGGASGPGGGGGRVAVLCDYVDPQADFNGLLGITAASGRGSYQDQAPSAGTVFIRQHGQAWGDLYLDDLQPPSSASGRPTPLTPIGFGLLRAIRGNTVRLDGKVPILPGALVGLRFVPNQLRPADSFAITANGATTLTLASPNEAGVSLAQAAPTSGTLYGGLWRFDNLTTRRGGWLILGDLLQVEGTLRLGDNGKLSHYPSRPDWISWLELAAGRLEVSSSSRIELSGLGYQGGRGFNEAGQTLGGLGGSSRGAGGSYGGLGGAYGGGVPGGVYGSLTSPLELGSGGGAWDNDDGGDGGGLGLLRAGTIVLEGVIQANGSSGTSAAGAGSGGTVNIMAGSLSGSGFIRANGGSYGVGGGGGRIALVLQTPLGLPRINIEAQGGLAPYGNGFDGTVYIVP